MQPAAAERPIAPNVLDSLNNNGVRFRGIIVDRCTPIFALDSPWPASTFSMGEAVGTVALVPVTTAVL